jgi:RNA polymerase sigma-70 factor (ECF subfamily)
MNANLDGAERFEELWAEHRRRVLDVGYRMLGSLSDAEDVAQEAYARLVVADIEAIDDIRGWLVAVASRICIDRLRAHEHSRRSYVGPWLPEPLVADVAAVDVADRVTLDESVRMALMVVLEQLSPAERTAFVLHDVFDLPFDQIGPIVGRSPQACRQLASRARRHIEADKTTARFEIDPGDHRQITARFAQACERGDLDQLIAVLDPAVIGDFDSGGAIPGAPLTELDGAERVARQLIRSLSPLTARFEIADVNGTPGVVVLINNAVVTVIALGIRHGVIDLIHAIGNPTKLTHLQQP